MSMNSSIEFVKHYFLVGKHKFSVYKTSVASSPEMLAQALEHAVKNVFVDLTFQRKFGRSDWGLGPPNDLSGFSQIQEEWPLWAGRVNVICPTEALRTRGASMCSVWFTGRMFPQSAGKLVKAEVKLTLGPWGVLAVNTSVHAFWKSC